MPNRDVCGQQVLVTCLQAPVAVGNHYGSMDMPYDGSHASRWDPAGLVNPAASASMPLGHPSLVQQPLLQDEQPSANN